MSFETIDDKDRCVAIYQDGKLTYGIKPPRLNRTWGYTQFLRNEPNIQYASLYCGGKTLQEVCPAHHRAEFDEAKGKMKAFLNSIQAAKVDLNSGCLFDHIPESVLKEWCEVKSKITNYVLKIYDKPSNYDFLVEITKLLTDIKYQRLNLDYHQLDDNLTDIRVRNFINNKRSPYISYNLFGTKTGRLGLKPDTFPILTMDKSFRKVIQPQNNLFVSFDYNAFDLRILLGLSGIDQPEQDLHDWNREKIFTSAKDRTEAKRNIFSWLYNEDKKDLLINKYYDRDKVLEKYWDGKKITNPFGRTIKCDRFHALNYLIQSTASDVFLRKVLDVTKLVTGHKSRTSFLIHDSVVFDFAREDKDLIKPIRDLLSDTHFGKMKVGVEIGKNFGEMNEIQI